MVELIIYTLGFKDETINRIADFFGVHSNLINGSVELNESNYADAENTLNNWINSSNDLYIINSEQNSVGFLHIGYRGDNVAWIEDIYVDKRYRNKGVATKAIKLAENIIKSNPKYTAICFDVATRNEIALKLYHKLGYDSVSIITVRKELYENKRNKVEKILGLDFKY